MPFQASEKNQIAWIHNKIYINNEFPISWQLLYPWLMHQMYYGFEFAACKERGRHCQRSANKTQLELFNGIRFPVLRSAYASHYLNAPFIDKERRKKSKWNEIHKNVCCCALSIRVLKDICWRTAKKKLQCKINIWHVRPTLCWLSLQTYPY